MMLVARLPGVLLQTSRLRRGRQLYFSSRKVATLQQIHKQSADIDAGNEPTNFPFLNEQTGGDAWAKFVRSQDRIKLLNMIQLSHLHSHSIHRRDSFRDSRGFVAIFIDFQDFHLRHCLASETTPAQASIKPSRS